MSASVNTGATSAVSSITEATRTSGRSTGGGRGRGGRRNRTSGAGGTSRSFTGRRTSTFKGATADMNANVFECFEEHGDRRQYARTVEALEGYMKKTMKYSEDLAPLFAPEMSLPRVAYPRDPGPNPSKVEEAIWSEETREYVKRARALIGNLATGMAVIWGQCSEAMKSKVKSHGQFAEKWAENDCAWLLHEIRAVTLQFDDKKNPFISLLDARASFLNCKQGQAQSADEYMEEMKTWIDNIEYHGGTISESHTLIADVDPLGNARSVEVRSAMARDRTIATAFIRNADPTRYGTLITELANQYARGKDEYPTDLTSAYGLLVNYTTPTNAARGGRNENATVPTRPAPNPETSAMTFVQRNVVAGTNGVTHEGITCFTCNNMGHYYSVDCPEPRSTGTSTGTTLTQAAYVLAQTGAPGIHPDWVLLDSQSTVSVFKNAAMLTNIRRSPNVLRAITNGGHQDSCLLGDFPNLGPVWFNSESIANILSLSEVRKVCRVTMDTEEEAAMCVHRLDGSVMKFVEHDNGLYVFVPNSSADVTGYTLVSTVADNKRMFTQREIRNADLARELYRKIGRPNEAEFQSILRRNLIRNCPVTPDDARRALIIYGPDIAALKGKTTHAPPAPRAPTFVAVPLPAPVLLHHRNVTLCIDLFFVQGLPFFHTISRDIGFRTVAPITDRRQPTLWRELQAVLRVYRDRGLTIRDVQCDHEFECLRTSLLPIVMNVVPTDSHVGEVERSIRTIKERLRACAHGLPFKRLPRLLITHMVADVVRCLNQFPFRHGVSSTLSPTTIVTGTGFPDYRTLTLEFGSYVQVFEDNSPSNTTRARSLGAITLTPTGNAQGDYYFLSLASGALISRHQWTAVPMTDATIARVEALAKHEGLPPLQTRGLVVEWRPDMPIDDDEYDRDYDSDSDDDARDDPFPLDAYPAVDDAELDDLLADAPPPPDAPPAAPPALVQGAPDAYEDLDIELVPPGDAYDENEDDMVFEVNDEPQDDQYEREDVDNLDEDQGAPPQDDQPPDEDQGAHENPGADHAHYQLRPRNDRQANSFRSAIDQPHSNQSYYPPVQLFQNGHVNRQVIFRYVLAQMSAKAAIRQHGKVAEDALLAEFSQMQDLTVYEPIDPASLTREQKRMALRAINLVQQKRCGRFKGRTVADGRPQRNLYDKSETASPTATMDALLLTILIDAYERRDVGTADIVGAYLKAQMDDFVLMKFTGESVDILCKMDPRYLDFVTMAGKTKVVYVRLVKAIYGCVKSALLWYNLFSSTLEEMGFVLNPYDPCIANRTINGKQCTIAWYVDDTKISHVDPEVVTSVISAIEQRFDKMKVTRGREHTFLGMNIKYTDRGTAIISMKDYLMEAIDESGLEIVHTAATPARRTLFEVNPRATPLKPDRFDTFRSVVMKLLYVALRARMDLLLAISFLSTRISKSTVEDEGKLKRVLEYIKGAADLEYELGADQLGSFTTWVDASYATHPDMKSHTGGLISFGTGALMCKSNKQKLNTRSSTEAEVVGASDYLPNTLWVQLFMKAQGYPLQKTYFEQDNESAIKLERNGRVSAGPKSRHIDIRYFWIKDRIKSANVDIRHCPTLRMIADFFTKPLQGNLFRLFRSVILGHEHTNSLLNIAIAPSEERVDDKERTSTDDGVSTEEDNSTDIVLLNELPSETWVDVVKKGKARSASKNERCVSRDHSLETIQ